MLVLVPSPKPRAQHLPGLQAIQILRGGGWWDRVDRAPYRYGIPPLFGDEEIAARIVLVVR